MRYEEKNDDLFDFGDITLCINSLTVRCDKMELKLTRNEFDVLHYLLKNEGKAISRNELLNNIWGYNNEIETRATDDTVRRLRRKLAAANSKVFIETIWGHGFKIKIHNNSKRQDTKYGLIERISINVSDLKDFEAIEGVRKILESYQRFIIYKKDELLKVKSNDELIFELRGRFLTLGSNHDLEKMKSLQIDCEKYLSSNEDNEHKHIENTIYILKASIDYNLNDNRKSAYQKIVPMLENLEFGKKAKIFESNYNRVLLIWTIALSKNYKQANKILDIIERSFEDYPVKESLKIDNLSSAYLNFIENLLYSKYYVKSTPKDREEIKKLFQETTEKARTVITSLNREELLIILPLKEVAFYHSNIYPKEKQEIKKMREGVIKQEVDVLNKIEYPTKIGDYWHYTSDKPFAIVSLSKSEEK